MKRLVLVALACLIAFAACKEKAANDIPLQSQGIVSVDSIELSYLREGSGPPILVIGSAIYYPRAFSRNLRKHFELIFVDSRHFVPSYQPSSEELQEVTLETFADDLDSCRRELAVGKVTVLGHSIHAQIAIKYATKYPQHTSHLILVGGVPYAFAEFSKEAEDFWNKNASDERKEILARNLKLLESELAAAPASRNFAVIYRANGPKYWSDPSFDAAQLFAGLETSSAFDRLFALLPSKSEVRKAIEQLQIPILVVVGGHDYAIPYPAWEEIVAGLENITYRLLNQSSHNPQTEHPELFDEELISWFESH